MLANQLVDFLAVELRDARAALQVRNHATLGRESASARGIGEALDFFQRFLVCFRLEVRVVFPGCERPATGFTKNPHLPLSMGGVVLGVFLESTVR
jgi:hypothetical protein